MVLLSVAEPYGGLRKVLNITSPVELARTGHMLTLVATTFDAFAKVFFLFFMLVQKNLPLRSSSFSLHS